MNPISTDSFRREWNWPPHEEWAKRRRACYGGDPVYTPDPKAADYASPAEIEQAIAELKSRWKQAGHDMAAAKQAAAALAKQPGETELAYVQRCLRMHKAEGEPAWGPRGFQHERKLLNLIIAGLRDGKLNNTARSIDMIGYLHKAAPVVPTLRMIVERRDAAWQKEYDEEVERIAKTPIDDDAWEAELKWRQEMEDWKSNGWISR